MSNQTDICSECGFPMGKQSRFCSHCRAPAALPEPETVEATPIPEGAAERAHFALEFNRSRVFLQGYASTFNIRVTPLSGQAERAKEIRLTLDVCGEKIVKRLPSAPSRARQIHFNHCPQYAGQDMGTDVELTYELDGRRHTWVGGFLWDCYPPEEAPNKVIDKLVVDFSGANLAHGDVYAGDTANNIRILENFKAHRGADRAQELKSLKLDAVWQRIEMDAMLCPMEVKAPGRPQARVDRCSLALGGRCIVLLAPGRRRIGRSRGNDAVIRVLGALGETDRNASKSISKVHCTVDCEERRFRLTDGGEVDDGGWWKVSSNGVTLDGRSLIGGVDLPVDRTVRVCLGKERSGNMFACEIQVLSMEAVGLAGAGERGIAGAILRRLDGGRERETVLFVCQRVPLGRIDPALRGWHVRHRDGCFEGCGGGEAFWLDDLDGGRGPDGTTVEAYKPLGVSGSSTATKEEKK
jgi:hypothetical protein